MCLQCLTPSDGKDDIHAGFAKLLSELNNPNPDYTFVIASRLYGEQSYEFLQVCMRLEVFHNQIITASQPQLTLIRRNFPCSDCLLGVHETKMFKGAFVISEILGRYQKALQG